MDLGLAAFLTASSLDWVASGHEADDIDSGTGDQGIPLDGAVAREPAGPFDADHGCSTKSLEMVSLRVGIPFSTTNQTACTSTPM